MSTKLVLTRNIWVGETLSFDNGRVVLRLQKRTGHNTSRVRFELDADVVVDKPKAHSESPKVIVADG